MADFFAQHFFKMGGYGLYVWTAYIVFFVVLLADAIGPLRQRQRTLTQLRGRLKREAAKAAQTSRNGT